MSGVEQETQRRAKVFVNRTFSARVSLGKKKQRLAPPDAPVSVIRRIPASGDSQRDWRGGRNDEQSHNTVVQTDVKVMMGLLVVSPDLVVVQRRMAENLSQPAHHPFISNF